VAWAEVYFRTKWRLHPSTNRHEPKTGGCAPFRGELGPHLTQLRLGRGNYFRTKWYLDPSSRLATHEAKNWVGAVPFFLGSRVPNEHKVAWAEAYYLHTKWHLSPSSRGCAPLGERSWFPL